MNVLSRSWALIKATLNVLSKEKDLLAYPLLMFLIFAANLSLGALSADAGYGMLVIPISVVGVMLFVLLAVAGGTLNTIYRSAVYLYAAKGEVAPQFGRSKINPAFGPKRYALTFRTQAEETHAGKGNHGLCAKPQPGRALAQHLYRGEAG